MNVRRTFSACPSLHNRDKESGEDKRVFKLREHPCLPVPVATSNLNWSLDASSMPTYTSNRSLLNPKFEGYKLDPITQEDVVTRHELEFRLTQATVSANKAPLSMQEVQSRITHNHLAVATGGSRALYIDTESRVVIIDVDPVSLCSFASIPNCSHLPQSRRHCALRLESFTNYPGQYRPPILSHTNRNTRLQHFSRQLRFSYLMATDACTSSISPNQDLPASSDRSSSPFVLF